MAYVWLDTPATALHSKTSESYFEKLKCVGGGPPFVKIGRRVLYRLDLLDAWLNEHLRLSTSDRGGAEHEPRSTSDRGGDEQERRSTRDRGSGEHERRSISDREDDDDGGGPRR